MSSKPDAEHKRRAGRRLACLAEAGLTGRLSHLSHGDATLLLIRARFTWGQAGKSCSAKLEAAPTHSMRLTLD